MIQRGSVVTAQCGNDPCLRRGVVVRMSGNEITVQGEFTSNCSLESAQLVPQPWTRQERMAVTEINDLGQRKNDREWT